MNVNKVLPVTCPSCNGRMRVQRLHCENCDTSVEGVFELPILNHLSSSELVFVLSFMKTSGSIKAMADQLRLSYPTVRNMLDELIAKILKIEKELKAI